MEQTKRLAMVATEALRKEFHKALVILVVACSSLRFSKRWVPGRIRPVITSTEELVAETNIHSRGNRAKNAATESTRYFPALAARRIVIVDHLPSSAQRQE
jgi:hypothetical protein